MKNYIVYYIIKMNNHGYIMSKEVKAKNQKEAFKMVKDIVRENSNRFAFSTTCKAPVRNKCGMEFNGTTYTRYNEFTEWLW